MKTVPVLRFYNDAPITEGIVEDVVCQENDESFKVAIFDKPTVTGILGPSLCTLGYPINVTKKQGKYAARLGLPCEESAVITLTTEELLSNFESYGLFSFHIRTFLEEYLVKARDTPALRLAVIYDKNGVIAGMRYVCSVDKTSKNTSDYLDFVQTPQREKLNPHSVYRDRVRAEDHVIKEIVTYTHEVSTVKPGILYISTDLTWLWLYHSDLEVKPSVKNSTESGDYLSILRFLMSSIEKNIIKIDPSDNRLIIDKGLLSENMSDLYHKKEPGIQEIIRMNPKQKFDHSPFDNRDFSFSKKPHINPGIITSIPTYSEKMFSDSYFAPPFYQPDVSQFFCVIHDLGIIRRFISPEKRSEFETHDFVRIKKQYHGLTEIDFSRYSSAPYPVSEENAGVVATKVKAMFFATMNFPDSVCNILKEVGRKANLSFFNEGWESDPKKVAYFHQHGRDNFRNLTSFTTFAVLCPVDEDGKQLDLNQFVEWTTAVEFLTKQLSNMFSYRLEETTVFDIPYIVMRAGANSVVSVTPTSVSILISGKQTPQKLPHNVWVHSETVGELVFLQLRLPKDDDAIGSRGYRQDETILYYQRVKNIAPLQDTISLKGYTPCGAE